MVEFYKKMPIRLSAATASHKLIPITAAFAGLALFAPDGHFEFPHRWPVKLPQAGRSDYESSAGSLAMRAAASLSR